MAKPPLVYFLCTGNACRSQMADGLARRLLPEPWQAASAGLEPSQLDRRAVEAMAELGIDISRQQAKAIDPALLASAQLVITLCDDADRGCPAVPAGTDRRHWPLADPARANGTHDEVRAVFRQVRDQLHQHLTTLADELAAASDRPRR